MSIHETVKLRTRDGKRVAIVISSPGAATFLDANALREIADRVDLRFHPGHDARHVATLASWLGGAHWQSMAKSASAGDWKVGQHGVLAAVKRGALAIVLACQPSSVYRSESLS